MSAAIPMLVAALAGGLAVYIFFAMKAVPYAEPADVYAGGVRIQQVAGSGGRRVLLACGALFACLVFLGGYLSGM